jgi:hypothetical protein
MKRTTERHLIATKRIAAQPEVTMLLLVELSHKALGSCAAGKRRWDGKA